MHSEFTSWLDAKVKSESTSTVRELITRLTDDSGKLESVIEKASKIVSENTDDFELPLGETDDVLEVLISEWNAYQSSATGMGKAVMVENVKSNAVSQKEITPLKKATGTASGSCINNLIQIEADWNIYSGRNLTSPFISGIAINAP